ncbi:hypothetical protein Pth03_13600 [Planotetraspora thailandica]|uniref:SCO6045-like C-terminal domain-containing protein n=1 Tax=Planotetraspora thailandica TaxID=487172 RepID=A0A8J3XUT3_9ACTN|nr:hypothetical protein [Planotetraspora thailandica]GII52971.1 hypothetical protein Pth03_13600 [Planotetraspora thailandica]
MADGRPAHAAAGEPRGGAARPPGGGEAGQAREALRVAQGALLAALVAGGGVPEGFDAERVGIQARSLIAKRRGLVARLRPELVRGLGPGFAAAFADYATGRPRPPGGSRADARAFAEWLSSQGRYPSGDEGHGASTLQGPR